MRMNVPFIKFLSKKIDFDQYVDYNNDVFTSEVSDLWMPSSDSEEGNAS